MLKHYWNTAIRNLTRNKLFTFINVIGLSIGIAIFLSLTGYVRYQFSFDKFYAEGDRIYRINYFEYQQGQPVLQSSRTHDRTALLVHEYSPEVEAVTRIYNEKAYVFTEDVRIVDQDMLFADSSFFKVFPVKVISGSPDKSLIAPKSVMISQSQAKVYFGNEDPVGKTLYFNERLPFIVTGVFEDIPSNASIDFDFLLSWSTMPYYGWISKDGDFRTPWTFTYVRLRKNVTDIPAVSNALTAMATKHITTLEKRGHTARYELQAYQDLHTSPTLSGEVKPGTSKTLLYVLVSLAVFILIAAWINYINLSLARSLERADEIGVRKVFGASRITISGQFLMEAFSFSVLYIFHRMRVICYFHRTSLPPVVCQPHLHLNGQHNMAELFRRLCCRNHAHCVLPGTVYFKIQACADPEKQNGKRKRKSESAAPGVDGIPVISGRSNCWNYVDCRQAG
jgi:putative ABC transport system permease protein